MRFMMLMIPRVYQPDAPPGQRAGERFTPPAEAVARMTKFNERMRKAGALITLDGLQPSALGARVRFAGGKTEVAEGPFAEAKEVVGGFWMIRAKSKEEAVAWARRCPAADGDVIEVRQVHELADFPPEVRKAVAHSKSRARKKPKRSVR